MLMGSFSSSEFITYPKKCSVPFVNNLENLLMQYQNAPAVSGGSEIWGSSSGAQSIPPIAPSVQSVQQPSSVSAPTMPVRTYFSLDHLFCLYMLVPTCQFFLVIPLLS